MHFENDKGLNERSIVFTHAKITLEEYGNVKSDVVEVVDKNLLLYSLDGFSSTVDSKDNVKGIFFNLSN